MIYDDGASIEQNRAIACGVTLEPAHSAAVAP